MRMPRIQIFTVVRLVAKKGEKKEEELFLCEDVMTIR